MLLALRPLFALAFLLCLALPAAGQWVVGEGPLLPHMEYFATDRPLTLAQVAEADFQPLTRAGLNQGVNRRHHWLRFAVDNPGAHPQAWVLRSATSYLDNLEVYTLERGRTTHTHLTDRAPFASRPVDYRTLSYAHTTPAGTTTQVYLKAYYHKADSVTLRFEVTSAADFERRQRLEHLGFGLFYGALATLIVMALFFALLLRQRNAINYALFLIFTALMWLMLNGLGFQYLWPGAVYWHNEGIHLVFLGFAFFALRFSRQFLQLRRLAPRFHRLFQGLQWLIAAGVLLRLLGWYRPVLEIAYLSLVLLALLIPLASALVWRRGLDYGLWSLLAWLFYSTGLIVSVVSAYTNLLPWGMSPLVFLQVGSLLETLFLMVGMAKWLVHMERERQRALAQAHEDPLTGLGNRRRLQQAFAECPGRAGPLFLIMIDLDHFKEINDSYGHDAGDAVLRDVGELLRRFCRKDDIAIRYGGEEFAVMLAADSLAEASQLAERLRRYFAEHPTEYQGERIHHTLCCGLVEIDPGQRPEQVRELMRRADAALYQAKAQGRNQSHIFQPAS